MDFREQSDELVSRVLSGQSSWFIDPGCKVIIEALRAILPTLPTRHREYVEQNRLVVCAKAPYATGVHLLSFVIPPAIQQAIRLEVPLLILGPETEAWPADAAEFAIRRLLRAVFARLDGLDEFDTFAAVECADDGVASLLDEGEVAG